MRVDLLGSMDITTPEAQQDEEIKLAAAAVSGDPDAFAQIVKRYQQPVFGLCVRYLGICEAEDMAQEAFIRAFVYREKFDPGRPMLPWLLTIARNLCIDRTRRKKPELMENEHTIADDTPGADEKIASGQEVSMLTSALEKLPENQREAVSLYHLEGLQYKEVAQVLEVPMGTVMTWLHRGRAGLRKIIEKAAKA